MTSVEVLFTEKVQNIQQESITEEKRWAVKVRGENVAQKCQAVVSAGQFNILHYIETVP